MPLHTVSWRFTRVVAGDRAPSPLRPNNIPLCVYTTFVCPLVCRHTSGLRALRKLIFIESQPASLAFDLLGPSA